MRTWEKWITLLLILVFLTSLVMPPLISVKADSTEPITFSSGLTLYSPINTLYNSRVVLCNGSFDCPQGVGCNLNYSIDGVYQGGLQWDIDGNSIANPYNYTLDGAFPLPALPNGSHQLSIGIKESTVSYNDYNSTMTIHETTWVNTVYFTISSSEPLSTPTLTPTSTITPPSYVSPKGEMSTYYSLTMYSPNNQTAYANTMLLNFSLQWMYDIIAVGTYQLRFEYAYSIDNNPFVSITPNQTSTDLYAGGTNLTINPIFSYLLNISNLTNGYHKIQIEPSFNYAWSYSMPSDPVFFSVQNPTPTPKTEAHTTLTSASIIVVVLVLLVVIFSLMVYRKYRKHQMNFETFS